MEVVRSEKDENATSDSAKVNKNDDYKDVEEAANNDKSRTYIETFHIQILCLCELQTTLLLQQTNQKQRENVNVPIATVAAAVVLVVVLLTATAINQTHQNQKLVSANKK